MRRPVPERVRGNARRLRREMTVAEKVLWVKLRDHRYFGTGFRRQAPMGGYIADFVCHEHRLIVELDGGQHSLDDVRAHDEKRDAFLRSIGYRVLRILNEDVMKEMDGVLHRIGVELQVLHPEWLDTPHPNPPPHGGRERARIRGRRKPKE
ncbi:MAG TPA: DUF559 domain-containing protein [Methylomirabilota bacterium]|nr:DUF559 domain-containing protein [Methylomirabilota bacterium]